MTNVAVLLANFNDSRCDVSLDAMSFDCKIYLYTEEEEGEEK